MNLYISNSDGTRKLADTENPNNFQHKARGDSDGCIFILANTLLGARQLAANFEDGKQGYEPCTWNGYEIAAVQEKQ